MGAMAVQPGDLAATLVCRHRQRREYQRQRAEQVRRIVDDTVLSALESGRFRRAWLIGSLAHGHFGVRSDVDLVVEGLPAHELPAMWNELCELLDLHVDLLRLEELPATFRERVLREGLPFHVT